MRRALFVALSVLALMIPTLASAGTPEGHPPESESELDSVPHVDRDSNRIADRLDAILAEAAPGDRIEVLATFTDAASQGASAATLPPQAVQRRLGLVPGFLGSLNKGQITALANQPGVVRRTRVATL